MDRNQFVLKEAKRGLMEYQQAVEQGRKVWHQIMNDSINLLGLATAATAVFPTQQTNFFNVGVNNVGSGFLRQKRWCETNFTGNGNQMPANRAFYATAVGFGYPTNIPDHIKRHLDRHVSVRQRKGSNVFEMGSFALWPAAEFHLSSPSVATTVAQTTLEYGQNGKVQMRELPAGAGIYLPPLEEVNFELEFHEGFNCTLDGLPLGQDNAIDEVEGCLVQVYMKGILFEKQAA